MQDSNNSALEKTGAMENCTNGQTDTTDGIVVTDPPTPERPELVEVPSMSTSVWESIETSSTKGIHQIFYIPVFVRTQFGVRTCYFLL